jgi:DNA sulfur modification protein DndD
VHLSEVTLKNWRSYRSSTFRFPVPSARKKVILVGAMNGTGKTSLLAALYLGLFGREAMYYVEGVRLSDNEEEKQRSYRQLIERILHRGSLPDSDPQVSVQLVFDIGEDDPLTVTRIWHFLPRGRLRDINTSEGEEVIIQHQNRPRRYASWQEANNRIEELLFPAHILPCFFFDGEQAQKRVEGAGNVALSDAMQTLYGTKLLSGLSDTLKQYINFKKSIVKREVGEVRDDELAAKRAKYDALDESLKQVKADLSRIRTEVQMAEATRKDRQEELIQISGNSAVDINIVAQERAALEQKEREQQDQLNRDLAALALPIAFKRYEDRVTSRLNAEIIRDRWQILREETSNKVEDILARSLPSPENDDLSPPLTGGQRSKLALRLREAIESIWIPPPDGCAEEFRILFLSPSDRITTLERIRTVSTASVTNVVELVENWQETKSKLEEVRRRWESVQDVQPRLRDAKERLNELNAKVSELNSKKSELEIREQGYTNELADLKAAIAQMEGLKQRRGPEENRIELAERVREVLRELEEKLKPLCEKSLAEACTKHFREMISSEYRNHRVSFDQDAQPMLTIANAEPVYVTTLSGAQKRAFGLAFTLAIAEVSGQDAPIVIDTPVGSMDSEFRKRILKYLAKSAPGQLFFLSHDEEIYGEYVRELDPYVAKKFLVNFRPIGEGIGESTIQPDKYFAERT